MRKIHQAIADARQDLCYRERQQDNPKVRINSNVFVLREGDFIHLYSYGIKSCSYDINNREFTVYIHGYNGKSFSQTELGYIRAFVFEGLRDYIKINTEPFSKGKLTVVRA